MNIHVSQQSANLTAHRTCTTLQMLSIENFKVLHGEFEEEKEVLEPPTCPCKPTVISDRVALLLQSIMTTQIKNENKFVEM